MILRAANNEIIGTRFPSLHTPLENRKRWILAGPKPAGRVVVDAGAENALCTKGRSLLPAGIAAVNGNFQRGDTISIMNINGRELARGLSSYSSADLTGQLPVCQLP